jgi:hypothetical protein
VSTTETHKATDWTALIGQRLLLVRQTLVGGDPHLSPTWEARVREVSPSKKHVRLEWAEDGTKRWHYHAEFKPLEFLDDATVPGGSVWVMDLTRSED